MWFHSPPPPSPYVASMWTPFPFTLFLTPYLLLAGGLSLALRSFWALLTCWLELWCTHPPTQQQPLPLGRLDYVRRLRSFQVPGAILKPHHSVLRASGSSQGPQQQLAPEQSLWLFSCSCFNFLSPLCCLFSYLTVITQTHIFENLNL